MTNPVIDGTNLVAKEGPALNERDGVLVLSRNAGAADTMADTSATATARNQVAARSLMLLFMRMSPLSQVHHG